MSERAGQSVDVLLCTFRRPMVRETLQSLDLQTLPEGIALRIVVADNDGAPTARDIVQEAAASMRFPVRYQHAPERNISVARNAALDLADADWVAFIDDDERAEPDWLKTLLETARDRRADAVFGPALARYGNDAPGWMRDQDHHSNRPERRGDVVETGHTCNVLLRWRDTPWREERFDLGRGRSGGEDTEFFFRLRQLGASYAISETAIVTEAVPPERLSFGWLARRKYRMGQSYAARAGAGFAPRLRLAVSATAKMLVCAAAGTVLIWSPDRRNYWWLRGLLHAGVVSGCLAMTQPEIYGGN